MTSPYDARRATEDELTATHGQLEWVVTLGETVVVNVKSLEFASVMASILNQEHSVLARKVETQSQEIARLRAALQYIADETSHHYFSFDDGCAGILEDVHLTADNTLAEKGEQP